MHWKTRDIVLTAILAAVAGAIYLGWDLIFNFLPPGLNPLVQAAFNGLWWIAGGLVPLIVRRPGAALLAEAIGGFVEFALGSPYGIQAFTIGIAQGIFIEVGFLLGRYQRYSLGWVMAATALGGIGNYLYSYFYYGVDKYSPSLQGGYLVVTMASGAILAGVVSWIVGRGLLRTGVLHNFPIGQEARGL